MKPLILLLLVTAAVASEQDTTRRILETSGVKGGLVVRIGRGELRFNESFVVDSLGDWRGKHLPYVDNLVNLLVADKLAGVPMDEVMRVLAPGGVALIGGRKTVKPWPKEIDEWSHYLHDASGDTVAHDRVVGPPRRLQWFSDPLWGKHHEGAGHAQLAMVSAGGRFFSIEDHTPSSFFGLSADWRLIARDAFNGVVLWRRPLSDFFMTTWNLKGWGWGTGGPVKRLLVATANQVFLPLSTHAPLSALDAATGEVLRTYPQTEDLAGLICDRGVLVGCSAKKTIAVRATTGEILWRRDGGGDAAAKDGRAFLVERDDIVGLELSSGREIWKTRSPELVAAVKKLKSVRNEGLLHVGDHVLLYSGGTGLTALAVEDGRGLWSRPYQSSRGNDAFIIGDLVWIRGKPDDAKTAMTIALDVMTGTIKWRRADERVWNAGHHVRCYPPRATDRFLLYNMRGVELLDLASGDVSLNNWIRATCGQGMIACNGLLYAGPHSCRCYSENSLHGLFALAPARSGARATENAVRLERGPAYANHESRTTSHESDWRTYRGDAARSGSVKSEVPTNLTPFWQTPLGGRLSSPVQAGQSVYVASVDSHTVLALDAGSGKVRWKFVAGGRVDSPPTIHRGMVLFGSADGWVYCLRATDAQLVWRFHAAPEDRFVGAAGQIESAWPIHGSILVKNDVAYCAAGRSSFLDGGIHLYALDPLTGRVLHQTRLEGPWPAPDLGTNNEEHQNPGYSMPGARADPMVADETRVYLGHMAFDFELRKVDEPLAPNGPPSAVGKWWDDAIKYASPDNDPEKIPIELDPLSYYAIDFGPRLYATSGLFDASWHNRQYWSYGRVSGNYLVFNGRWGYAVKAYRNATRWTNHRAGDGYVLFAGEAIPPRQLPPTDLTRWRMRNGDHPVFEKGKEVTLALCENDYKWSVRLPFRPVAMVLAGDTLFAAGPPDPADPTEALAAIQGKRGGLLAAVSAATGAKLAELKLDSAPIFDGLIAAAGKLLLSTHDGKVLCLAQP